MILAPNEEELERGENIFAMSALNSLREGVEVTSFPLVGRKDYPLDPTTGRIKGAHSMGPGQALIASMIGSG